MTEEPKESGLRPLPPPWDRIFSLGTRIFVWGLIGAVIYLLRPFFLLIFLTFVFAYLLEHGVQALQPRIDRRPLRVVLVTLVFLGTLVTIAFALVSPFMEQARQIREELPTMLKSIDEEIGSTRQTYIWTRNLIPEDLRAKDVLEYLLGLVPPSEPDPAVEPEVVPPPTPVQNGEVHRQRIAEAVQLLHNVASPILGVGSSLLLALLFSFLIVLDLPKLSRSVRGLADTKVGFIYEEVAANIRDVGMMVGKALEAQLLIAVCNTILTAIGLWVIGLTDNTVFLSTIVFVCSFVPVAGVFISSTPICLQALVSDGVGLMLLAIILITVIHLIEAYVLNPRIFGHHLRMNPVLVLIVLTIAGKLFGVWGLILGLPVVNYVFGHAIRRNPNDRQKISGISA